MSLADAKIVMNAAFGFLVGIVIFAAHVNYYLNTRLSLRKKTKLKWYLRWLLPDNGKSISISIPHLEENEYADYLCVVILMAVSEGVTLLTIGIAFLCYYFSDINLYYFIILPGINFIANITASVLVMVKCKPDPITKTFL